MRARWAKASGLFKKAEDLGHSRSTGGSQRAKFLNDAADQFQTVAEMAGAKKDDAWRRRAVLQGAECYCSAGEFAQAAEKFATVEDYPRAAGCFRKAQNFDRCGKMWWNAAIEQARREGGSSSSDLVSKAGGKTRGGQTPGKDQGGTTPSHLGRTTTLPVGAPPDAAQQSLPYAVLNNLRAKEGAAFFAEQALKAFRDGGLYLEAIKHAEDVLHLKQIFHNNQAAVNEVRKRNAEGVVHCTVDRAVQFKCLRILEELLDEQLFKDLLDLPDLIAQKQNFYEKKGDWHAAAEAAERAGDIAGALKYCQRAGTNSKACMPLIAKYRLLKVATEFNEKKRWFAETTLLSKAYGFPEPKTLTGYSRFATDCFLYRTLASLTGQGVLGFDLVLTVSERLVFTIQPPPNEAGILLNDAKFLNNPSPLALFRCIVTIISAVNVAFEKQQLFGDTASDRDKANLESIYRFVKVLMLWALHGTPMTKIGILTILKSIDKESRRRPEETLVGKDVLEHSESLAEAGGQRGELALADMGRGSSSSGTPGPIAATTRVAVAALASGTGEAVPEDVLALAAQMNAMTGAKPAKSPQEEEEEENVTRAVLHDFCANILDGEDGTAQVQASFRLSQQRPEPAQLYDRSDFFQKTIKGDYLRACATMMSCVVQLARKVKTDLPAICPTEAITGSCRDKSCPFKLHTKARPSSEFPPKEWTAKSAAAKRVQEGNSTKTKEQNWSRDSTQRFWKSMNRLEDKTTPARTWRGGWKKEDVEWVIDDSRHRFKTPWEWLKVHTPTYVKSQTTLQTLSLDVYELASRLRVLITSRDFERAVAVPGNSQALKTHDELKQTLRDATSELLEPVFEGTCLVRALMPSFEPGNAPRREMQEMFALIRAQEMAQRAAGRGQNASILELWQWARAVRRAKFPLEECVRFFRYGDPERNRVFRHDTFVHVAWWQYGSPPGKKKLVDLTSSDVSSATSDSEAPTPVGAGNEHAAIELPDKMDAVVVPEVAVVDAGAAAADTTATTTNSSSQQWVRGPIGFYVGAENAKRKQRQVLRAEEIFAAGSKPDPSLKEIKVKWGWAFVAEGIYYKVEALWEVVGGYWQGKYV